MENKTHDIWNVRFVNRIIESMAEGVFTMDSEGRISSWNHSMELISGYSAQEALGQTCRILDCNRCFGKECPAGIKHCGIIEKGLSGAKECHLRHKNGYDVPVIKNASVVRDNNNVVIGVVETVTDLTELNKARQKAEEASLRLGEIHSFGNIIGKSHSMVQVYTAIKAAAASNATILIQGESGTGKELVAGAIHYNSERRDKPLVTVNCSSLTETLLESELFGHVRGAFTGSIRDRAGRFEEAEGGTIFLDEIGELSPFIQVKLLRVLQEREIERVGESKKRKIDIRVITATHQDLSKCVSEGRLREDLYYRLRVFPIRLPPLRERKEDIPILVSHFIGVINKKTGKQIKGTSIQALRLLMNNVWPGNVRELENSIEHAFVLCNREQIDVQDLPFEILNSDRSARPETPAQGQTTGRRVKPTRETLLNLLNECRWNKAEVGRRIGLSRTAVWKYMKKWNIPLENPLQEESLK